jgi:hypothetical protein
MKQIIPAYGRDYKSAKAVISDFDLNKDFRVCDISDRNDGKYVNKTDLQSIGVKTVFIRYARLSRITEARIGKGEDNFEG